MKRRDWVQDRLEKTVKSFLRAVIHKGLKKLLPEGYRLLEPGRERKRPRSSKRRPQGRRANRRRY